jgi:Domain of unknown function (DUF4136)
MKAFACILVIVIVGTDCQMKPQLGELVNDMVVQTNYDNTVNFSSYASYTMLLDTLGRVSGTSSDTIIVTTYAQQITDKLKSNLDSRGYSWVEKTQNPDFAAVAYIVDDLNVFQTVNYYQSYYPGYYYPNYYGNYGSYYGYPSVSTYAYNTAVLVIEIVDLKNKDAQGRVKVVWTAYIGDVLSSVDPFQKSVEAVTQAFDQSPYLSK